MSVVETRPLPAALAGYAAGTEIDRFEWWCRERAVHSVGPYRGRPLDLEDWQHEFFSEALAVDADDLPYWSSVVLIVPRKNGKSTMMSAVAGYRADEDADMPLVGIAATSDEQAKQVFGAVAGFISASPYLSERFHVRDYDGEIARTDAEGFINRLRMDFRRLHGKNLSALIADELHAWTTPNLTKCWEALTTGDAARPAFQAWCITTEGEPDPGGVSIMGVMVQTNEAVGDVEHRGALTISRNHDSRTLIYRYAASPKAADPAPVRELYSRWAHARNDDDPDAAAELRAAYEAASAACVRAVAAANPASWVQDAYLARKIIDAKLKRSGFLRLHACVAADADDAFISTEDWAALADPIAGVILPGATVCLGFDGSRSYDTTVAAWATRLDDDRVAVRTHVFSARADAPHHELCAGKKIDFGRLKTFVEDDLFGRFVVTDGAFDPRYLVDTMEALRERLAESSICEVEPQSKLMRDALAALHELVEEERLVHDGDPVLAAHVAAANGKLDRDRGWSVRKRDNEKPIDALIAAALAVWRVTVAPAPGDSLEVW